MAETPARRPGGISPPCLPRKTHPPPQKKGPRAREKSIAAAGPSPPDAAGNFRGPFVLPLFRFELLRPFPLAGNQKNSGLA